jgi:hypothetical protein
VSIDPSDGTELAVMPPLMMKHPVRQRTAAPKFLESFAVQLHSAETSMSM